MTQGASAMSLHLVQLKHPNHGRRIARVGGEQLRLLKRYDSVYSLALDAIQEKTSLTEKVESSLSADLLPYEPIYRGTADWRLLPAIDHPHEESRCLVSGTGLTHKSSAMTRQA